MKVIQAHRRWLIAFSLIIVFLLSFTVHAQTTGSVSGTVTDQGGSPLANMAVGTEYLDDRDGDGTCTDASGNYSFGNIPLDVEFYVIAQGNDQCGNTMPYAREYWEEAFYEDDVTVLEVTSSTPDLTDIDFTLEPAGTVTGVVTVAGGGPLEGIDVIGEVQGEDWDIGECTDENGVYVLQNLPLNENLIIRTDNNDCDGDPIPYIVEYWEEEDNENNADPIYMTTAFEVVDEVDFTLELGGSISGVVLDEFGAPIVDAQVTVETLDWEWVGNYYTEADGSYTVTGIPDGDYYVYVETDEHIIEYYDDIPLYQVDDTLPVHVSVTAPNNTPNINFTLAEGGSISGYVLDELGNPIADVQITVETLDWQWMAHQDTEADGSYTVTGIPDGDYYVYVDTDGYVNEYYDDIPLHEANSTLPDVVSVTVPNNTPNIDFELEEGGSISGYVLDESGNPIADADVGVETFDWQWVKGKSTGADGSYTIMGIPEGDYRVKVRADGYAHVVYNNHVAYPFDFNNADLVHVTTGVETPNINFNLPDGGTVLVTVYDDDGITPLEGVPVDTDAGGFGRCTDENGQAFLEYLPLNTDIYVRAGGQQWGGCSTLNRMQEYYDGTPDYDSKTPVRLTSAGQTKNISFDLAVGGSISGHVFDKSDDPIADAYVRVETLDWQWVGDVSTNADGSYTIMGISEGDYRVQVEADGYARTFYDNNVAYPFNFDSADPVHVNLGVDTPNIDFNLADGGTIVVTVYEENGVTPIPGVPVDTEPGGFGRCTDQNGQAFLEYLPTNTDIYVRAGGQQWGGCSTLDRIHEYYDDTTDYDNKTPVVLTTAGEEKSISFNLPIGGSISGFVYDTSGNPIGGAEVFVETMDWDWIGSVFTNADGSYIMVGLPTDDYRIEVHADGYAPVVYDNHVFYPFNYDRDRDPVSVIAGVETENINFNLPDGGTIVVTVYDDDGITPLEGVPVDTDPGGFGNCTDANGQVFLEYLPINKDIYVQAGGTQWGDCPMSDRVRLYSGNVADRNDAIPNRLRKRFETEYLDFELYIGGSISGTVTDTDTGAPLQDIVVDLNYGNYGDGTCTDENGEYSFSGIAYERDFRVVARSQDNWCGGPEDYVSEFWEEVPSYNEAVVFNLSPISNTHSDIDFTLNKGGFITGTVTATEDGSTLSGIWVCAIDFNAAGFELVSWKCGQTDGNGEYLIQGVAAGQQRVWLFPDDRLRLFYNNSTTFDGATPVTVTAEQTTSGVDFSLPLAGFIIGQITEADGTPIQGVMVSTDSGEYPECTNADGIYHLYVPAGTHIIKAESGMCDSRVDFPTQLYDGVFADNLATPITVALGETISGIDFTLDSPILATPVIVNPICNSATVENQPAFKWQSVAQGTMYEIQLDTVNPPEANFTATSTQFKPPSPLLPTTYYWRVQASNHVGKLSEWSAICSLDITSTTNAAPLQNYFTTDTPTLTWNGVADATEYDVEVGIDPKFANPLSFATTVQGDTLYVVPTSLDNGTYYWRVRAKNDTSVGSWSIVQTFIVNAP